MKKIIATVLCLTITSPCFAVGRFENHYPANGYHNVPPVHYGQAYRYDSHRIDHRHPRVSKRTKTIGAVVGIAGIAMLISAIAD